MLRPTAIFVLSLLSCSPVAAQGRDTDPDEDDVLLWVVLAGGKVDRDEKRPGKPITAVHLNSTKGAIATADVSTASPTTNKLLRRPICSSSQSMPCGCSDAMANRALCRPQQGPTKGGQRNPSQLHGCPTRPAAFWSGSDEVGAYTQVPGDRDRAILAVSYFASGYGFGKILLPKISCAWKR
jgi:hypothetical protein